MDLEAKSVSVVFFCGGQGLLSKIENFNRSVLTCGFIIDFKKVSGDKLKPHALSSDCLPRPHVFYADNQYRTSAWWRGIGHISITSKS